MSKILDKIKYFFRNFKMYKDFDDFLEREDIEVLTFSDGVAARWHSYISYKKGIYRITERHTNQIVANDYDDLTIKLKKKLKQHIRFPFLFSFGLLLSFGLTLKTIGDVPEFATVLGFIFGFMILIAFLTQFIKFIYSRTIYRSKTTITKYHIKYFLPSSLFYDVLKKVNSNE